ncbi:hypothetical protein H696_00665 [Fonticula alba]|uniref:BHLH domain-containing protein n=1 Tax=Fonticula alba TaxID=691883 RepID=A0A058ZGM6_FONAL|nr:hypothetical protein H696_00665 [Fonticula alba]KCV73121.1 hypothetical protein H696_00665 [Fonticula alba]|eukprot:XP_009492822.1 hypothetical protein H696_00665 [Fonticula alba]
MILPNGAFDMSHGTPVLLFSPADPLAGHRLSNTSSSAALAVAVAAATEAGYLTHAPGGPPGGRGPYVRPGAEGPFHDFPPQHPGHHHAHLPHHHAQSQPHASGHHHHHHHHHHHPPPMDMGSSRAGVPRPAFAALPVDLASGAPPPGQSGMYGLAATPPSSGRASSSSPATMASDSDTGLSSDEFPAASFGTSYTGAPQPEKHLLSMPPSSAVGHDEHHSHPGVGLPPQAGYPPSVQYAQPRHQQHPHFPPGPASYPDRGPHQQLHPPHPPTYQGSYQSGMASSGQLHHGAPYHAHHPHPHSHPHSQHHPHHHQQQPQSHLHSQPLPPPQQQQQQQPHPYDHDRSAHVPFPPGASGAPSGPGSAASLHHQPSDLDAFAGVDHFFRLTHHQDPHAGPGSGHGSFVSGSTAGPGAALDVSSSPDTTHFGSTSSFSEGSDPRYPSASPPRGPDFGAHHPPSHHHAHHQSPHGTMSTPAATHLDQPLPFVGPTELTTSHGPKHLAIGASAPVARHSTEDVQQFFTDDPSSSEVEPAATVPGVSAAPAPNPFPAPVAVLTTGVGTSAPVAPVATLAPPIEPTRQRSLSSSPPATAVPTAPTTAPTARQRSSSQRAPSPTATSGPKADPVLAPADEVAAVTAAAKAAVASASAAAAKAASMASGSAPTAGGARAGGPSASGSRASPPGDESDDEPAARDASRTAKKSAHNIIERRYRLNINEKISDLRDLLPLFPPAAAGSSLSLSPATLDQLGARGPSPNPDAIGVTVEKMNKGKVLKRATDYILLLQAQLAALRAENARLRDVALSVPGGAGAAARVPPTPLVITLELLDAASTGHLDLTNLTLLDRPLSPGAATGSRDGTPSTGMAPAGVAGGGSDEDDESGALALAVTRASFATGARRAGATDDSDSDREDDDEEEDEPAARRAPRARAPTAKRSRSRSASVSSTRGPVAVASTSAAGTAKRTRTGGTPAAGSAAGAPAIGAEATRVVLMFSFSILFVFQPSLLTGWLQGTATGTGAPTGSGVATSPGPNAGAALLPAGMVFAPIVSPTAVPPAAQPAGTPATGTAAEAAAATGTPVSAEAASATTWIPAAPAPPPPGAFAHAAQPVGPPLPTASRPRANILLRILARGSDLVAAGWWMIVRATIAYAAVVLFVSIGHAVAGLAPAHAPGRALGRGGLVRALRRRAGSVAKLLAVNDILGMAPLSANAGGSAAGLSNRLSDQLWQSAGGADAPGPAAGAARLHHARALVAAAAITPDRQQQQQQQQRSPGTGDRRVLLLHRARLALHEALALAGRPEPGSFVDSAALLAWESLRQLAHATVPGAAWLDRELARWSVAGRAALLVRADASRALVELDLAFGGGIGLPAGAAFDPCSACLTAIGGDFSVGISAATTAAAEALCSREDCSLAAAGVPVPGILPPGEIARRRVDRLRMALAAVNAAEALALAPRAMGEVYTMAGMAMHASVPPRLRVLARFFLRQARGQLLPLQARAAAASPFATSVAPGPAAGLAALCDSSLSLASVAARIGSELAWLAEPRARALFYAHATDAVAAGALSTPIALPSLMADAITALVGPPGGPFAADMSTPGSRSPSPIPGDMGPGGHSAGGVLASTASAAGAMLPDVWQSFEALCAPGVQTASPAARFAALWRGQRLADLLFSLASRTASDPSYLSQLRVALGPQAADPLAIAEHELEELAWAACLVRDADSLRAAARGAHDGITFSWATAARSAGALALARLAGRHPHLVSVVGDLRDVSLDPDGSLGPLLRQASVLLARSRADGKPDPSKDSLAPWMCVVLAVAAESLVLRGRPGDATDLITALSGYLLRSDRPGVPEGAPATTTTATAMAAAPDARLVAAGLLARYDAAQRLLLTHLDLLVAAREPGSSAEPLAGRLAADSSVVFDALRAASVALDVFALRSPLAPRVMPPPQMSSPKLHTPAPTSSVLSLTSSLAFDSPSLAAFSHGPAVRASRVPGRAPDCLGVGFVRPPSQARLLLVARATLRALSQSVPVAGANEAATAAAAAPGHQQQTALLLWKSISPAPETAVGTSSSQEDIVAAAGSAIALEFLSDLPDAAAASPAVVVSSARPAGGVVVEQAKDAASAGGDRAIGATRGGLFRRRGVPASGSGPQLWLTHRVMEYARHFDAGLTSSL